LKKKDTVALIGFGTFKVAQRKARKGRNPQAGEEIKIKAKQKHRGQTYIFDKILIKLPGKYGMKYFVGVTDNDWFAFCRWIRLPKNKARCT